MPYGTVYEISFQPQQTSDLVVIRIYDKATFNPNPLTEENIIPLNDDQGRVPLGNLRLETIDNDEDKFTPVKGTQAVFSFFSNQNYNLNTFLGGEDDRFLVKVFITSAIPANLYYIGYLVVSGMSEGFLPYPQAVTLTAIDGLGLIGDKELTDFDGIAPKGMYKIIEYIAFAVKDTGIELPFAVINNIMEESDPGTPFYESCYLDAKTFEDSEPGKRLNAREVLEQILGEESFIFQWKAKYYIVRVDELEYGLIYTHNFDFDGNYVGVSSPTDYNQTINSYQAPGVPIPYFMGETALVSAELAYKNITLTRSYDHPSEIPDNKDFSRGVDTLLVIVVDMGNYFKVYASLSDFPTTGESERTYKAENTQFYYKYRNGVYVQIFGAEIAFGTAYENQDWQVFKDQDNPTGVGAITYIVKITELGYERARYAVIDRTAVSYQYIRSNKIPVQFSDRFNVGVSVRYNDDLSGGFYRHGVLQVKLYGDDGTHWTLHGGTSAEPAPKWYLSNSNFTLDQKYVVTEGNLDDDNLREWKSTMGGQAPPIPVSGDIEILLVYSNTIGNEMHFSDLQFEYIPFINGSYQKYSGETHSISQSLNVKAKREKQVYIGNGPNKLTKGCLQVLQSGRYVQAQRFYAGNVFPSGLPSFEYLHPFNFIRAYATWNQFNRVMRIIDGDVFGLHTEDIESMHDLLHKYTLVDPSPHGNNKMFMLLHKVQDFDSNMLSGRFIEVFDTSIGKVYLDPYSFKYISS